MQAESQEPQSSDTDNVVEIIVENEEGEDIHGEQEGEGIQSTASPSMELEKIKAENKQLQERVLRVHADMDNMRRRMDREKQDSIKFANQQLLQKLIGVVDNFERAVQAAPDLKDNFAVGVNMIYKQLTELLAQSGVEEILALGKNFDPYLHEALAQEETRDHAEHAVMEVFMKGYRFQGRVLRPAKVKVAAAPSEREELSEEALEKDANQA